MRLDVAASVLLALGIAAPARAAEWPSWRGPGQDGVSAETGLISSWSLAGENLIWKADLSARSTPVVFDGRACTNGRAGEGDLRQEFVACFDAATGKKLWEHRFNPYHTAVPWNRVGWASLAGDPETGNVYAQGVGGSFVVLDRAGKVVWERNLVEHYGFFSGFGGRTQTPVIDGDHLIVTFVSGSWGDWGPPRHRLFCFDKRTGDLIWVSTPGGPPMDLNTQSTPVVAVVEGQKLVLFGTADGFVYAVNAHTGEKVWGFQVSKLALNTTVLYDPATSTVFAAHSEENPDGGPLGRVVAWNAVGSGDITKTHERWRAPIEIGFSSPMLHGGRLYYLDNSANLYSIDTATGQFHVAADLGTVGKSSAVWADGKIYATEVNGRVHVLKPGPEKAESLDVEQLHMPDGRPAEIYGSPAIAYGRVYFTAENGLYCLGDAKKPFSRGTAKTASAALAPAGAPATKLLLVPAEQVIGTAELASFRLMAVSAAGVAVLPAGNVEWGLEGLAGSFDAAGRFTPDPAKGTQVGKVTAKVGGLTGSARVRVWADLPMTEDFEKLAVKGRPSYLLGAGPRFEVAELEGGKVLMKTPAPEGVHRHRTFIGHPGWSDYTLQADLMGVQTGRKVPDVGLVASGYTVDLMGAHQQIQIRSWESELRASKELPYPWQMGVWYTMKLSVEAAGGGKARIKVKVWPRAEPEPAEWTLVHEDPLGILAGAPALYGFTPSPAYFDNVRITRSSR